MGSGILDAIDGEPGVRKQCAAIIVTRKRYEIPRTKFSTTELFTTYFLIVVPVSDAKVECWKRVGLAWAPRYIPSAPEMSIIRLV